MPTFTNEQSFNNTPMDDATYSSSHGSSAGPSGFYQPNQNGNGSFQPNQNGNGSVRPQMLYHYHYHYSMGDPMPQVDQNPYHEVDMGNGWWKMILVDPPLSYRNSTTEWKFGEYDYHEDWLKESVEDMMKEPVEVKPEPVEVKSVPVEVKPEPVLETGYNPIKDTIWTEPLLNDNSSGECKWEYHMDGISLDPKQSNTFNESTEPMVKGESKSTLSSGLEENKVDKGWDYYIDVELGDSENEEKEDVWEDIPMSIGIYEYGENVEFRKDGYWYLGTVEEEYDGKYTISYHNMYGGNQHLYDFDSQDMRRLTGMVGGLVCQVLWQGEWYEAKVKSGGNVNLPNVEYVDARYYGFDEYGVDPIRIRFCE